MNELVEETEARRHPRFRYAGYAEVGPTKIVGSIEDLSYSGCRVWLREPGSFAMQGLVELRLRANQLIFRGVGEVKAVSADGCMLGLEFVLMLPKGRADLTELIEFLVIVDV